MSVAMIYFSWRCQFRIGWL